MKRLRHDGRDGGDAEVEHQEHVLDRRALHHSLDAALDRAVDAPRQQDEDDDRQGRERGGNELVEEVEAVFREAIDVEEGEDVLVCGVA